MCDDLVKGIKALDGQEIGSLFFIEFGCIKVWKNILWSVVGGNWTSGDGPRNIALTRFSRSNWGCWCLWVVAIAAQTQAHWLQRADMWYIGTTLPQLGEVVVAGTVWSRANDRPNLRSCVFLRTLDSLPTNILAWWFLDIGRGAKISPALKNYCRNPKRLFKFSSIFFVPFGGQFPLSMWRGEPTCGQKIHNNLWNAHDPKNRGDFWQRNIAPCSISPCP